MAAEMRDCKRVNAPMIGSPNFPQNTKPLINQELVQLYQSHIKTLMWAYIYTRQDLGFLISLFSRFCSNPTAKHLSTVKRVYKYL